MCQNKFEGTFQNLVIFTNSYEIQYGKSRILNVRRHEISSVSDGAESYGPSKSLVLEVTTDFTR